MTSYRAAYAPGTSSRYHSLVEQKQTAYSETVNDINEVIKLCETPGWDGNEETPAMLDTVWKNALSFAWSMFSFVRSEEHFAESFIKPDIRVATKGTLGFFWPSNTLSHKMSVGIVFRDDECKISFLDENGLVTQGNYQPISHELFWETLKTIYYGRNPLQESGRA